MLLAVMTTAALAFGCSSSGSSTDAGGGSGGGGATGTGGTGGQTTASCQTIRLCARDCADDACVQNTCKPMAPSPVAQDTFQALSECTADPARGNCPTGWRVDDCLCMAQYRQDPPCADLLAACVGNISDVIADLCF